MNAEFHLPADLLEQLRLTAWLDPWRCHGLDGPDEGRGLETALLRELPVQHVLFPHRQSARAVARRDDCDDVLFWVEPAEKPFALVHLTWNPNNVAAECPWTVFYESLAAFAQCEIESLRNDPDEGSDTICE